MNLNHPSPNPANNSPAISDNHCLCVFTSTKPTTTTTEQEGHRNKPNPPPYDMEPGVSISPALRPQIRPSKWSSTTSSSPSMAFSKGGRVNQDIPLTLPHPAWFSSSNMKHVPDDAPRYRMSYQNQGKSNHLTLPHPGGVVSSNMKHVPEKDAIRVE